MGFFVVTDLQNYYGHIMNADNKDKLIICYFTATWCGPCRNISPDITTLGEKADQITVLKIDVDDCEEVSAQCQIDCMPTFKFHLNNSLEPVAKFSGADKTKLFNVVGELLETLQTQIEQRSNIPDVQPDIISSPEQAHLSQNGNPINMEQPQLYDPSPNRQQ